MAQLDVERIAKAALAIVDERGLAGLTFRAIADALHVTPMALYHHVEDKAGLARLVVDLANTERPLPYSTGDWKEDLIGIALWMRACGNAHPAVLELQRTYRVWTDSMIQVAERWVSIWQQSGLNPELILLAASSSSMAISGLAVEEAIYRDWEPPNPKLFLHTPNARQLLTNREDPAVLYELAARAVIDGLYDSLSKGVVPRVPKRTGKAKAKPSRIKTRKRT